MIRVLTEDSEPILKGLLQDSKICMNLFRTNNSWLLLLRRLFYPTYYLPLNEALGDRDKTMNTIEPYLKRPVKFLKQVNSGNWRIKVYGISAKSESLPEELFNEGVSTVLPHLPEPPMSEDRYGVGFLIIHQGTSPSPSPSPSTVF